MAVVTHVLVDLDGTLSDSEPGIAGSLRYALAAEGLAVPDDDVLRGAIGPPFELGLPVLGVPADRMWAVIDHYRHRYEDGGLFETAPYPGVEAMLDDLAAAGIVLAVATSKPEPTAVRIVDHFGWRDRFAVVAGATYEPGRRTKADVIGYALAELGIEGGPHVVMVGDREHDVHGARAHGIDCIGVAWGYGGVAELEAAGAASIAATPADVVAAVTALGAPRRTPLAGAG